MIICFYFNYVIEIDCKQHQMATSILSYACKCPSAAFASYLTTKVKIFIRKIDFQKFARMDYKKNSAAREMENRRYIIIEVLTSLTLQ